MRIAIVGATGSLGGKIYEHVLRRNDVDSIVVITRKPPSITAESVHLVIIPDFGDLNSVSDEAWSLVREADALIWAIGTYDLNEDANLTFPLEFQRHLALQLDASQARANKPTKFKFILLGGAFTETDQSRSLFFLPDQRRMKGLLQTRTLEFAESHNWAAHVVRPGGVLMGDNMFVNNVIETMFRSNLAIRGDELGAFVANLAINGSERHAIENLEMVETGRRLLAAGA